MKKKKKLPHSRRDINSQKPIHCILKTMVKISFHEKNAYHYIISLIKKVEAKYYVNIFQYHINGNHLHFFIITPNKEMISNALRYIGSMLARYFNKKLRRKGAFFEDRYFSSVKRSAREIRNTVYYIANQYKKLSPFKSFFSSISKYRDAPFSIPQYVLNLMGVGRSAHKLIDIITKNICPYKFKSKKKEIPLDYIQIEMKF